MRAQLSATHSHEGRTRLACWRDIHVALLGPSISCMQGQAPNNSCNGSSNSSTVVAMWSTNTGVIVLHMPRAAALLHEQLDTHNTTLPACMHLAACAAVRPDAAAQAAKSTTVSTQALALHCCMPLLPNGSARQAYH
jgi:hypothetical protein